MSGRRDWIKILTAFFFLLPLTAAAPGPASATFWLATDGFRDSCLSRLPRGRGQKTAYAGASDTPATPAHCNCSVIQTTQQGARARAARVSGLGALFAWGCVLWFGAGPVRLWLDEKMSKKDKEKNPKIIINSANDLFIYSFIISWLTLSFD